MSPRLTPELPAERTLKGFPEWKDWPARIREIEFTLAIGVRCHWSVSSGARLALDSDLWGHLFDDTLPVDEFTFKDMSRVNLRSFPVRNVMAFVRKHYRAMSLRAGGGEHPKLLPWSSANPALKAMLAELGTRLEAELGGRATAAPSPGFGRFHLDLEEDQGPRPHEAFVNGSVFNDGGCIKTPLRLPGDAGGVGDIAIRALPPDWEDPARIRDGTVQVADTADRERRARLMEQFESPAEYAFWQAERFYSRTTPSKEQRAMRRRALSVAPRHSGRRIRLSSTDCVVCRSPTPATSAGPGGRLRAEPDAPIDALLNVACPAQGFMRLNWVMGPHSEGRCLSDDGVESQQRPIRAASSTTTTRTGCFDSKGRTTTTSI